jgi:hypothetical protein
MQRQYTCFLLVYRALEVKPAIHSSVHHCQPSCGPSALPHLVAKCPRVVIAHLQLAMAALCALLHDQQSLTSSRGPWVRPPWRRAASPPTRHSRAARLAAASSPAAPQPPASPQQQRKERRATPPPPPPPQPGLRPPPGYSSPTQQLYSSSPQPITSFGFARGFSDKYELEKQLGSGTFGVVHVARNKETGER